MQIENFELASDEVDIVREIRATNDRSKLIRLNNDLGFRLEGLVVPELLRRYNFTDIKWFNEGRQHSGPEAIDFGAVRYGRKFGIEAKTVSKDSGAFSISGSKYDLIELFCKSKPEIEFGLLLMKVSGIETKGSSMLLVS